VKDLLSCWQFLQEFLETTAPLGKHFRCIIDSCQLTRSSSGLRKALGTVLAVGNYMNGGSARGQADGFALEALDLLSSTKDVTNSISLLEYVAMYLLLCCHVRDSFDEFLRIAIQKHGVQFPIDLEKELSTLGSAVTTPTLDTLKDDVSSVQKSTQVPNNTNKQQQQTTTTTTKNNNNNKKQQQQQKITTTNKNNNKK
jgi:Formin Homology 2 Domain